ncbi:hypothetical protein B0H13DRAFT_2306430 [Mycena leptocephala]|nr:hypothetical protein B0H13DRAFT_2306430 [Mycena leptocephala]
MAVSGSAFSFAAALLQLSNNLCRFAYGLTLWEVMELLKARLKVRSVATCTLTIAEIDFAAVIIAKGLRRRRHSNTIAVARTGVNSDVDGGGAQIARGLGPGGTGFFAPGQEEVLGVDITPLNRMFMRGGGGNGQCAAFYSMNPLWNMRTICICVLPWAAHDRTLRPESSDLVQAGPSVPLATFSAPPALLVPQGPVVAFYGLARPNAAASVQLQRRLAMQRDGHLWAWIFFMEPLRGV